MSNITPFRLRSHKGILITTFLTILLLTNIYFYPTLNVLKALHQPSEPKALNKSITSSPNAQHLNPTTPFIGWPLQRLCTEQKTWTPGLIFSCSNNSGGIGNIRNYILTCLRYALEAGATGLLIPQIRVRSNTNTNDTTTNLSLDITSTTFEPFTYFFSSSHFKKNFRDYCPQLVIYDKIEEIPGFGNVIEVENFSPKGLGSREGCDRRDLNRHISFFQPAFLKWLNTSKYPPTHTPNITHPVIISLKWGTFFEWPVWSDGPEFGGSFGGLLRFREGVIGLSEEILRELGRRVNDDGDGDGEELGWMGVHLRTENDALKWWPGFEEQTAAYLTSATEKNYINIYLASGSDSQIKNFTNLATTTQASNPHSRPIKVYTKHSLLSPSSLSYLERNQTWDQQALVDFLVLMRAEWFMGSSMSSFAMNIALRRHLLDGGLLSRPWRDPGDQWSELVGRFEGYWDDWGFMREGMWP